MVAVITGGAKGIGRQIVKTFVANGYKVAFCYNTSEAEALELCNQMNDKGKLNCVAYQCDVRDYQNVRDFINYVKSVFGEIDIVVNNAGIANFNLLMDLEVKDWRNIMSTNLDSVFYMCKECIPYLLKSESASIINISSVWGVYGASNEVAYSASKAGVIGLTKGLAQELGGANIRVNCIAAGVIDSDMNKCLSEEAVKELANNTPLGRIGKMQEIADTVLYLASNKSSFITGQVIEVTGGFK